MRPVRLSCLAAIVLLAAPAAAAAQVGITPRVGIYIPAGEFSELEDGARTIEVDKEAALTLGATLELGRFYAGFDYVTGSQLSSDGVSNGDNLGDGTLLALAGGIVIRLPIPLIQPHIRLGAGVKRLNYSVEDQGVNVDFPDDDTDFSLHGAAGVSLGLGGLGIVLELADYVTVDGFAPNDFILSAGLRLGF
jgi:hypothetical protein